MVDPVIASVLRFPKMDWSGSVETVRGIEPPEAGWDSEMIAYPCVFDFEECNMFYNGNGYGRAGIGLAILERD
jgi:hypothetical protein